MENEYLRNANKSKKDEFYTSLTVIEKEIRHYKKLFKGSAIKRTKFSGLSRNINYNIQ